MEYDIRSNDYYALRDPESTIDRVTQLPKHSLYGERHKPTPAMLEGVDVVRDGGKVQFVVKDEKTTTAQPPQDEDEDEDIDDAHDDEDESFEGFGDDPVEGEHVAPSKDRHRQDGLASAVPQEQAPGPKDDSDAKKDKKAGKKQQQGKDKGDHALGSGRKGKEAPGANPFSSLADAAEEEEEQDGSVDVAAWAELSLSPAMLSAVSKLGFPKPTEIQAQAIPQILDGEDVIGKAQTGSGKTLAFGIPIVERWLEVHDSQEEQQEEDEEGDEERDIKEKGRRPPLAVVLSPTRELAKQLGDHLQALCKGLPSAPYVCVITGGLSIQKQRRQLQKADVIIGTPGRLWEVLEGDVQLQESFTKIQFLVVDEADRLFKAGQFKEAEDIIGALDRRDPEAASDDEDSEDEDDEDLPPRQTLVFSATFDKDLQTKLAGRGKRKLKGDSDENKMEYLMKCLKFRREPKFIDVNPIRQMAEGLKEGLIECGAMEKVGKHSIQTNPLMFMLANILTGPLPLCRPPTQPQAPHTHLR
jgi:ATP-dependent RNA helicase DDX24/MAK5